MRPHQVFLVCAAVVLVLALMPQPAAAADGDTSAASITSFSQTNPADGADFWPDGSELGETARFAENFVAVADWGMAANEAGESIATDGDVGAFHAKYDSGASDGDRFYHNYSIAASAGRYWEIRYRLNTTNIDWIALVGWQNTIAGGTGYVWLTLTKTTSWTTYGTYQANANAIASLGIYVNSVSGQNVRVDIDYLRVSATTEARGWQHDCSATGNITAFGASLTSDGDVVTMTTGGVPNSYGDFFVDNTATAAMTDSSYYTFFECSITSIQQGSMTVAGYDSGSTLRTLFTTSTAGVYRANLEAVSALDWSYFRFIVAQVATFIKIDYVRVYAIANFTTTVTGGAVGDVAYVSSNALLVTKSTATLFQFDRDPAISVASATYSRWNISTATPSAVGCSLYVAAWTTKDGESTWWMPSGTSTDVRIRVTASATISALKFLADSSAPVCVWSSATPSDPTTTDSVSLWAVITDSYALYKVYFRPITYPAGFSAVDYSATQQQNNLWLYTFSSLPLSGVYCFVVVGTDGANNNTLGATTYLTFTVREAEIIVTTITLFGAGDDFDFVTWAFDINRACTYTIREWSGTYAAADTWTGSVAEGIRNIAWPKLSLTDDYVNFTVTFVNGSLSYAFSSSYAMPKSTFYFESYLTGEGHKFNAETVWCSGTLSKAATYTIYCDNTQVETGTVSEDFYVDIDKGLPKGQDHLYAFRFVNGSQTLWVNCTYYSYASDQDEPERGGTGVTTEEYWMRTLTVLTFIGICMIGIGVARIPNLPNYRGR